MSTDDAVIGFDSPPPRVMMPNSVSMPTIFGTAIGSDRGMGSETGVGSASEQPAAFRGSKRPHGREAEVAGHRYWPVATRSMDRPPCRSSDRKSTRLNSSH